MLDVTVFIPDHCLFFTFFMPESDVSPSNIIKKKFGDIIKISSRLYTVIRHAIDHKNLALATQETSVRIYNDSDDLPQNI